MIALCDSRLATAAVTGCRLISVSSAAEEQAAFDDWVGAADWTLLIAPEINGVLLDRCRRVEGSGARLISPGSALVRLASDKHATAQYLSERGVRVPDGVCLQPGETLPHDFPYPAVLKPCDGAGSCGVRRVSSAAEAGVESGPARQRLERWQPGFSASVSLLCGPGGVVPLEPCAQTLSEDGRFHYLGGWTPLPEPLATRPQLSTADRKGAPVNGRLCRY